MMSSNGLRDLRPEAGNWKHEIPRAAISRVFLLVMSLIYLSPMYWMFVTALKSNAELGSFPPTLWPHTWAWQNIVDATKNFPFLQYLWNTTFYAVFTVIGAVLSNFLIAYGFSRIKWPGRELLFYPVIASIFVFIEFPVNPITMIPVFTLFTKLNLVNSFVPLILPSFFGNPFFIFLLRQFMLQIPDELSEAARLDGANEWQIMTQIILPLTKPAIAVVALLAGVNAWKDFLGPVIYLHDDSLYTLSIGLEFFKTEHRIQFNLLMAASCLVILPLIIVFSLFQRFFIQGVTLGSGKPQN
jgi:multiple sugar transport system permease protein